MYILLERITLQLQDLVRQLEVLSTMVEGDRVRVRLEKEGRVVELIGNIIAMRETAFYCKTKRRRCIVWIPL